VRLFGDLSACDAFYVHTVPTYIYDAADFEINESYNMNRKMARSKIEG